MNLRADYSAVYSPHHESMTAGSTDERRSPDCHLRDFWVLLLGHVSSSCMLYIIVDYGSDDGPIVVQTYIFIIIVIRNWPNGKRRS